MTPGTPAAAATFIMQVLQVAVPISFKHRQPSSANAQVTVIGGFKINGDKFHATFLQCKNKAISSCSLCIALRQNVRRPLIAL